MYAKLLCIVLLAISSSQADPVLDDFIKKVAENAKMSDYVVNALKKFDGPVGENGTFEGINGTLTTEYILTPSANAEYTAVNTSFLGVSLNFNLTDYSIDFPEVNLNSGSGLSAKSKLSLKGTLNKVIFNMAMVYNLTHCYTEVQEVQVPGVEWTGANIQNVNMIVVGDKATVADAGILTGSINNGDFQLDPAKTWAKRYGLLDLVTKLDDAMANGIKDSLETAVHKVLSTMTRDVCHDIDI